MDHPFEVGKTYQNRYGRYQVISIDEPKMLIRYEDGREIKVTIDIQARILAGIRLQEPPEKAAAKGRGKAGAAAKKGKKSGKTAAEKREKLVAEILKKDETVFEILSRLTIPPGQIDLYRLFITHRDDYFGQQQIADAVRGANLEGQRGVFMAFGKRIGASPDPRVHALKPYNSLFFQHKQSGGKTLYRIRQRVVEIFRSYPLFYDFLMNDKRSWLPDEFGTPSWESTTAVHQAQLHYFGFWEHYEEANKKDRAQSE